MQTLVPSTDGEIVRELEEGETRQLKKIVKDRLEEAEVREEYDIGYERNRNRTAENPGTFYEPREKSSYYDGPDPEIKLDIETEIENFYANVNTGDIMVKDSEGNTRKYRLLMSCDEGMLLKGEIGYSDREVAEIKYRREEDGNMLKVKLEGQWRNYGKKPVGEAKPGSVRQHIEAIDSIYRQLDEARKASESEEQGMLLGNYADADARTDLKLLDQALGNLKDNSVNSITEFERKGEARVDKQDHPFNTGKGNSTNGAKGGDAARRIAYKFAMLNRSNIIDYKVRVGNGHPSADIEISEDTEQPSIQTVSGFTAGDSGKLDQETIEDIVEERFEK